MITQENIPYTADEIKAMVKTCEKYNKALKMAKECLQDGTITTIARDYIWEIFPELAESEDSEVNEDERIRKGLINGFKECLENCPYPKNVVKYWHDIEIDSILNWLEKQGEQKPVDKVKPKFKKEDWIIHQGTGNIYQVVACIDNQYQLKYGDSYTIQRCDDVDRCARLWNISDAKDGDILVTTMIRNCPFIYRKTNYNNDLAYYYAGIDGNGNFCEGCLKRTLTHFGPVENVCPATKEQRDLLFEKMKEAGYNWDAKNKTLWQTR